MPLYTLPKTYGLGKMARPIILSTRKAGAGHHECELLTACETHGRIGKEKIQSLPRLDRILNEGDNTKAIWPQM